jgi:hypothetical protein
MITIYFPGHGSHFEGKFTDVEIRKGLEFLNTRYPKPPFTRSRIIVLREPGNLHCSADDVQGEQTNPTPANKRAEGLLQSDLAYCEQWRKKRMQEMMDFMAKLREPGNSANDLPTADKQT